MKAYIIYVKGHSLSEELAVFTLASMKARRGWEPVLFPGLVPADLAAFKNKYPIALRERSRAARFFSSDRTRYWHKKACSMNHYRLSKKCLKLGESIAVIEHDSLCVGDWAEEKFDDVLVLNASSAIKQYQLEYLRKKNKELISNGVPDGVNDINFNGLVYRHDPKINGAHIMPGTAAYAITPAGAEKMVRAYEEEGWEQSDHIINTAFVRIQTVGPEKFTFQPENLEMSHGPAKFSASDKATDKRTICEVHREIYDLLEKHVKGSAGYPEIISKLEEVYRMGKKMSAKLRQYKYNYDEDWWEDISKELYLQTLSDRANRA